MSHSSSPSAAAAEKLLWTTELDAVTDHEEPYELFKLRERLATDRERLQEHLENPDGQTAGYLGLDELFWTLRFSWADIQDYVEEANNALINEERGFRSEWLCVKELADGSIVPDRPRIHRHQTLDDYQMWADLQDYPISAWEEEDYLAATEVDDEDEDEERIPWEDYDQDDLNKMDRQLSRGY
jgi:hypothetical protein